MKNFENPNVLFLKVVRLQEEIINLFSKYTEGHNIDLSDFREKSDNQYEQVIEYIFDEINGKSENMKYITEHMLNLNGNAQLVVGFVKAHIADQILKEVALFTKE
jgi:hypothetical protein